MFLASRVTAGIDLPDAQLDRLQNLTIGDFVRTAKTVSLFGPDDIDGFVTRLETPERIHDDINRRGMGLHHV